MSTLRNKMRSIVNMKNVLKRPRRALKVVNEEKKIIPKIGERLDHPPTIQHQLTNFRLCAAVRDNELPLIQMCSCYRKNTTFP